MCSGMVTLYVITVAVILVGKYCGPVIKKRGIFMLFNYIPWIYKVIIEILNTIDIISIRPTIQ